MAVTSVRPFTARREKGLRKRLRETLLWLACEQPLDAVLTHHGIAVQITPEVSAHPPWLSVVPGGSPGESVRFTLDDGRPPPHGGFRMTMNDVARVRAAFEAELPPGSIRHVWGEHGDDFSEPSGFVSILCRIPINSRLADAVDRYHAGCPDHPNRTVFCDCRRWRDGFAALMWPVGWRSPAGLARARTLPRLTIVKEAHTC